MNYTSISTQGNILSSEIFEKIRFEDIRFQSAKDFNLNPGDSVRDEINSAWSLALTNWQVFKQKREALSTTDSGTTETRQRWILPLLQILGFETGTANAELVNNKSYAISHRASNKDGFPIHIIGINQSLDKRADSGGARLSAHALMQEYLNNTEHLYGITTNGALLRILRDATRLTRLSYVEFNLKQMMEEGLFVEFALLYRTLHASRFASSKEDNANSIIEWYHQEALSSGSRIREKLSSAVEHSIQLLANGLLANHSNQELRNQLSEGRISANNYYLFILRTVYRILFLLVIEERKLIYPEKRDADLQRKRDIYYQFYSVQRLSKLIQKNIYIDPKKTDLWQSLMTTFRLFEYKDIGNKLGIASLGSGLFAPSALGGVEDQALNNETLLQVLKYLLTFENDNQQLVRVNYADLDVEEFGSIYEGLLEYAPEVKNDHFNFIKGTERSSSGSHYTPEELVKPLITHSLDYLIADKLKEADPIAGLLSLNICDVACGSGHILLSAARRVGFELAKLRSGEDQPTPTVLRVAVRDVIKNCIYGVDLNPLAVELCKVALWLEAHEPGQPLNFLDHHIKCGNAIVGLAHFEEIRNGIASEAFKTLPGDDKEIASAFKKKNDAERKSQLSELFNVETTEHNLLEIQKLFSDFSRLPEDSAEQIAVKELAYKKLTTGKQWFRLKQLADIQVAQFFIPKTIANKEKLTTYAKYKNYVTTGQQILDQGASMAIASEKRFFHWFLEFPTVFMKGGFDCILGNPPFLGGQKLSGAYGYDFLEFVRFNYKPLGAEDLVTYFFRRNFLLLKDQGFLSLISTNSVAQGKAREGSLEFILNTGGVINFAISSMTWPGLAAVEVSLITISKGNNNVPKFLNAKSEEFINSFLSNESYYFKPNILFSNTNQGFQGSIVLGKGFILEPEEAKYLLSIDINYKNFIFPYLTGDDLYNNLHKSPSRYVINFFELDKEKAQEYTELFKIIEERVKPQRDSIITEKDKKGQKLGIHDYRSVDEYWKYLWPRPELYSKIKNRSKVLVQTRVSKTHAFVFSPSNIVFSDATIIFAFEDYSNFSCLQSTIHEIWAWKFSSTMKGDRRYSVSEAFSTFPTPLLNQKLEIIGEGYYKERDQLANILKVGLTKLYNIFHSTGISRQSNQNDKHLIFLIKHLAKSEDTVSFEEAVNGIIKLRQLHKEMDEAVLEAYGWSDINLRHDFYEVDYLPVNDRVRYTIHPEARKEVLKRLLELNHKIHVEEVAAGLWDKKKTAKKPAASNTPKKLPAKSGAATTTYQSPELFEAPHLFNQEKNVSENCRVTLKNTDGKILKYHITPKAEKGSFTDNYQQIKPESAFGAVLMDKEIGTTVEFSGVLYRIDELL